jgi:non-ribosomal peptide synthetase component E (peptide arylation enzyme)
VPEHLAQRYLAEGWWDDATLGQTVAEGLGSRGDVAFRVWSDVRPWTGTFGDVDRAARTLADSLRARGVGPGDVVVIQLPNWVEAGIAFWAAAYLGAVVVPVVHFYGAKEVDYIIRATSPDVVVTADRFGHNDYLATYGSVLGGIASDPLWLVVGDTPGSELPAAATPFDSLLDGDLLEAPLAVDPDRDRLAVEGHLAQRRFLVGAVDLLAGVEVIPAGGDRGQE